MNTRIQLRNNLFIALILVLAGLGFGNKLLHAALTPTSYQLKDNIAGGSGTQAGKGTINVLSVKTLSNLLTGADLEAFRQESADGKTLSFAVDVNENSSGLETSRAQGVAIKSATLTVVNGGNSTTYTHFWTETQALIAEKGSTTRTNWYTLLGDAGSSLITGRKIGTTVYDSTLKFEVPADLTGATSVTMQIQLLVTDPNFGEPENFYDFSGGFEDLALITKAQAKIYDVNVPYHPAVAFRQEAPAVALSTEGNATLVTNQNTQITDSATGTTYSVPVATSTTTSTSTLIGTLGAAGYQIVAFEDSYPNTGDYDFNDLVVAYRLVNSLNSSGNVVAISGDAYQVARGAGGYNHRWFVDIPLSQNGVTAAAYQCTVQQTASATAISTSNAAVSTDPLACVVQSVNNGLRIYGFMDTYALLPSMNTNPGENPGVGSVPHVSFSVTLSTPVPVASVLDAQPQIEINRALTAMPSIGSAPYQVGLSTRDAQNKPYAMIIPSDWAPPLEGTDIGLAYPSFANFVISAGAQNKNWYQTPNQTKVVGWRVKDVAQ